MPVFRDPRLERAVGEWDELIRRNDLNNGEMLALLVMVLFGNLAMADAPLDLKIAAEQVAKTLDPRPFLRLCDVELAGPLPDHWPVK